MGGLSVSTDDGNTASEAMASMIASAIDCARNRRWVAAGAVLVGIRQRYEASDPTAFPADERTWGGFAGKHLAEIGPARVEELIGAMVHRGSLILCGGCGATSVAVCGCGVAYEPEHPWGAVKSRSGLPTAMEKALAAILANPGKSDRRIAAEIGVGNKTVSRARARLRKGA